jgi:hypothetical protein
MDDIIHRTGHFYDLSGLSEGGSCGSRGHQDEYLPAMADYTAGLYTHMHRAFYFWQVCYEQRISRISV